MPKIFISYRRADSRAYVGRLTDWLDEDFGRESIFRDIDAIGPGMDFVEAIEASVGKCDALIAVIGQQWLNATNGEGRRLDNPHDYVRLEVALALRRRIPVIPVLVDDATMPSAEQLPDDLQRLARIHAHEISDNRWDTDVKELIATLKGLLAPSVDAVRPPAGSVPVAPGDTAHRGTVMVGGGQTTVIAGSKAISPRDAALWSALVSGLGQYMTGQRKKGVAIFLGSLVLATTTAGGSAFLTWPAAIYDAYAIGKKLREGRSVGEWECF